jgi:hypothetical protein
LTEKGILCFHKLAQHQREGSAPFRLPPLPKKKNHWLTFSGCPGTLTPMIEPQTPFDYLLQFLPGMRLFHWWKRNESFLQFCSGFSHHRWLDVKFHFPDFDFPTPPLG